MSHTLARLAITNHLLNVLIDQRPPDVCVPVTSFSLFQDGLCAIPSAQVSGRTQELSPSSPTTSCFDSELLSSICIWFQLSINTGWPTSLLYITTLESTGSVFVTRQQEECNLSEVEHRHGRYSLNLLTCPQR